jgi:hypothetical protein
MFTLLAGSSEGIRILAHDLQKLHQTCVNSKYYIFSKPRYGRQRAFDIETTERVSAVHISQDQHVIRSAAEGVLAIAAQAFKD